MVKSIRTFFLSLTILAFLLFSTVGTTTVYADDGTGTETTETGTTTEEQQPTETVTDEEAPVTEEEIPVTEEQAPTEGETQPVEEPATDEVVPADETEVVATILEQIPEDTTLTVLNADGETLPLASQETADTIASDYDPIWCPAGQVPTPGENGCTPTFTSFSDLLTYLQEHENDQDASLNYIYQAGTIYVQQGDYPAGETDINFNDYNFNQINNHDLTVQGGWDTSYDPSSGSDPTYTTTNFNNVSITIGSGSNPWLGSLTFNNILIDGVTNQTGLALQTEGNIELNNVEVTNSESGADLNAGGDVTVNDSKFNKNKNEGAVINAGGNTNVTNSQFNENGSGTAEVPVGKGLDIVSAGTVTLISTQANNNQLFGANVDATGDVTVTNSFFNSNKGVTYSYIWEYDGYGIKVSSTEGNIKFDGVTANENYLFGAQLTGNNIEISNSYFSENSSGGEEESTAYGLDVTSAGKVTLASVSANNNQRFGANIESIGEVEIQDSFFNGNQSYTWWGDKEYFGYGLRIVTAEDVSLINVEATNNNLFGAYIQANDVAIDTANFSNNGSGDALNMTGYGLQVISEIDVALTAITANNNQLFGANVQATGAVSIAHSYFNGHIAYYYDYFSGEILSRDGGYGLNVATLGPIAINDVTAEGNYLYGASLEGGATTVENSNFNANGSGVITDPTGYGLMINSSSGKVVVRNVNANDNQLFGADVTATGKVTIVNSFFSGHQTVTFTPCLGLTFFGYGLTVETPDDIDLNGVTANFNNLWGASLSGDVITVYNSQFNNNVSDSNIFIDDTGLIVNATGYVDIYKVEAKDNRLIGATITSADDVYITDSTFTGNQGYTCLYDWCPEGSITYHGLGLQVTSPGLIYVSGTNASNNNLFGAELNGSQVQVKDSIFNNNGMGNGLTVNASNNVTLTNITAINNGGNGVDVTGVCQKIVQVTGGTFSDNLLYGLNVIDSTLNLDGTQIFANNGSGDFFNDTSTCVIITPTVITPTVVTSGPFTALVTTSNSNNATTPSAEPVETLVTTTFIPASFGTNSTYFFSPNTAKINQNHAASINNMEKADRKASSRSMKFRPMRSFNFSVCHLMR